MTDFVVDVHYILLLKAKQIGSNKNSIIHHRNKIMPAVTVEQLTKMKPAELLETRNRLTTIVTNFHDRFEKDKETLTAEEREQWVNAINECEVVNKFVETTEVGLAERSAVLTANSNLATMSNVVRNFTGSVHTRPAFEEDPRFGFATDRDFLNGVMNAYIRPDKADDRIKAVVNAVGSDEYSKGDWKSAGVLIPEQMIDRILSTTPEADFITPRCTRIPMGSSTVKIPARVDKDHSTSVTGGTRVYRTKETATVGKTKDTFEMVALEATEIVGEAAATKILMRESPISIPALIEASMKAANVDKRIDEMLLGNGQGVPLGVLNEANAALLSIDRSPGQLDTEIVSGMDVIRMAKHCYGYGSAVWIANFDLWELIQTLVIESPNAAGIIKLFSPVEGTVTGTLWGRPIYFTEYAPGILTNTGSDISDWSTHFLSCINFSEVLYGELYTEFNRSVHVRFSEREEVFQFVTANDAKPWWKEVLTPKRGITQRSPFVALSNTSVEESA